MNLSNWMGVVLFIVLLLAVAGAGLLVKAWPRPGLTPDERRELAGGPMPALKKRAWAGLAIAIATTVIVSVPVWLRGAEAYWTDDAFRLTLMLVFIVGLAAHSLVTGQLVIAQPRKLDERDRAILARAPIAQTAAILLALAGWLIALGERFHDQGAVPTVYLYLMFGSVFLVMMIAHSLGILALYWIGSGHGGE